MPCTCTCTSTNVKVLVLYLSTFICTSPHAWVISSVVYLHVHKNSKNMAERNTHNVSYSIHVEIINGRGDMGRLMEVQCRSPYVKTKITVACDSYSFLIQVSNSILVGNIAKR